MTLPKPKKWYFAHIAPKLLVLVTFKWSQKMLISPELTHTHAEIWLNSPWESTVTPSKVSFAHFQMQIAPKPMGLKTFKFQRKSKNVYLAHQIDQNAKKQLNSPWEASVTLWKVSFIYFQVRQFLRLNWSQKLFILSKLTHIELKNIRKSSIGSHWHSEKWIFAILSASSS